MENSISNYYNHKHEIFLIIDRDDDRYQNGLSLSKNQDPRHDNGTDRDDRDDRHQSEIPRTGENKIEISNHTHWECLSCGTGLRNVGEESLSSGNILKVHEKSGKCSIKYYTKSEAEKRELE
jgi:hypothetical protein